MRDRRLQRVQAVIQREKRVAPERDNHRLLRVGERRGIRGFRPSLQVLHLCPLSPLCNRLGVDPQLPAQRRERSLRSLYCCSEGVRGRGAPMTYLSHMASFHSHERIAPSNPGIKHLGNRLDGPGGYLKAQRTGPVIPPAPARADCARRGSRRCEDGDALLGCMISQPLSGGDPSLLFHRGGLVQSP